MLKKVFVVVVLLAAATCAAFAGAEGVTCKKEVCKNAGGGNGYPPLPCDRFWHSKQDGGKNYCCQLVETMCPHMGSSGGTPRSPAGSRRAEARWVHCESVLLSV